MGEVEFGPKIKSFGMNFSELKGRNCYSQAALSEPPPSNDSKNKK